MSRTAAGLAQTDSLEAQDPHRAQDDEKKKKKKKPASMLFSLPCFSGWRWIKGKEGLGCEMDVWCADG